MEWKGDKNGVGIDVLREGIDWVGLGPCTSKKGGVERGLEG